MLRDRIRKGNTMIHNGTYTLVHQTGHYTVRVKTQKDDARFAPGRRVIQLLVGADNEGDYKGFGFVNNGVVTLWRQARISAVYKRLAHLVERGANLMEDSEDQVLFTDAGREYTLRVSKQCLRCNRTLTHPESLVSGYGPLCVEKVAA